MNGEGKRPNATPAHHASTASNERFWRLLDHSRIELYIADAHTLKFLYVSPIARRHLQYGMDELSQMTPFDLVGPCSGSNSVGELEVLKSDKNRSIRAKTKFRCKGGATYPVELEWTLSKAGSDSAWVGIVIDRTRHDHAADSFTEAVKSYQSLFENSPNAVYTVDRQGRFTSFNPAAYDLTGYSLKEGLHKPLVNLVIPEDRHIALQSLQEAIRGLSPRFQCRIQNKAGRLIHLDVTMFPIVINSKIVGAYGIARDISVLKQAEEALRESEERFRIVAQVTNDAIWDWNLQTHKVTWSSGYSRIFGYESPPTNIQQLWPNIHSDDRERVIASIDAALKNKDTVWSDEYGYRRADGTYATVFDKGMIFYDLAGHPMRMIGAMIDITERKEIEKKLIFLAQKDPLTELANRNLFYDHINLALHRAQRHHQKVALMFMDLDRFKSINDALGHDAGDRLLKAVAQRLRETLRDADMIARLGGDEFTIILEEVDSLEAIARVAEKIIAAFANSFELDGRELFTGASLGISLYPADAADCEELIKKADAAMYHAKAQGRNNFKFYSPYMNAQAAGRLEMETRMRLALTQGGEFLLHYQPQTDPETHRIIGLEALLRWNSPELGHLLPDRFIPLAEETGLIIRLGEWVLRTACKQTKAWQEAGLGPLRIAVNLSARQLNDGGFVQIVTRVLNETGLLPKYLELELTEAMLIEHPETNRKMLEELKVLGVHLAIDDFGTGYSSLSYLKLLPVDVLKIDKSFIRSLPENTNDAAISSAIITMAHGLDLKVIAEGVETKQQQNFLKDKNCDYTQGYFIARPMPPEQITAFIQKFGDS